MLTFQTGNTMINEEDQRSTKIYICIKKQDYVVMFYFYIKGNQRNNAASPELIRSASDIIKPKPRITLAQHSFFKHLFIIIFIFSKLSFLNSV